MKKTWPLGKGRYGLLLAQIPVTLSLCAEGLWFLQELKSINLATLQQGNRPWVLFLFIFAVMGLTIGSVYRRRLLQLLLPTPCQPSELFGRLAPKMGAMLFLSLSGIWIVLPNLAKLSSLWIIPQALYACLLLRFLVPLLALLALALRKVLLPYGHWLAWPLMVGFISNAPVPGTEYLLLSNQNYGVLWLLGAAVLIPLGTLANRLYQKMAPRYLDRDELLDYAFPIGRQPTGKRRRVLTESIRGRPRLRRILFLLQTVTRLHRATDWARAGIYCLVLLAGAMIVAFWNPTSSAVHMLFTLGIVFILVIWTHLRGIRWTRDGVKIGYLEDYGLPVGRIEYRLVSFGVSCILILLVGLLIACGFLVVASLKNSPLLLISSGQLTKPPLPWLVFYALANLVQFILLFQAGAFFFATSRNATAITPTLLIELLTEVLTVVLISILLVGLLMWAFMSADAGGSIWEPHLTMVLQIGALWLASKTFGTGEDYFIGALEDLLDVGRLVIHPTWQAEALSWALPILLFALGAIFFCRLNRGKTQGMPRIPVPQAAGLKWR